MDAAFAAGVADRNHYLYLSFFDNFPKNRYSFVTLMFGIASSMLTGHQLSIAFC